MANRIFVIAVIVLWLGSMSWLMVDKVLPSYYGRRAAAGRGVRAQRSRGVEASLGRAATSATRRAFARRASQNTTNLENRVVLDDVPLLDLVPALMRQVVGDIGRMKLDADTRLEFDSLDNFSAFKSTVSINDITRLLQLNGG